MSTTLLNPYCTLSDVQNECENHDSESAVSMMDAINVASRYIDSYCRRDFLWHDASSVPFVVPESMIVRETIFLPWPMAELSKITSLKDGVEETIDPKDFRVRVNVGSSTTRIIRAGKWVESVNVDIEGMTRGSIIALPPEIRIYGKFGFAPVAESVTDAPSPSLPGNVRRACTVIAAVWSGNLRKQVHDFNGGSTTVTQKAIPSAVMEMLDALRIPIV
ncbi:MAG TPA: hypothetical protein PKI32_06495 [Opitutales bacterium]|nr:hypothetical protein [Opitutales bacterium]